MPDNLKGKAEELRETLIERAAESDDDLLEKFFDAGELSPQEIETGLKKRGRRHIPYWWPRYKKPLQAQITIATPSPGKTIRCFREPLKGEKWCVLLQTQANVVEGQEVAITPMPNLKKTFSE